MTDMNSFKGTFFEGGKVAHSINVGYNENGVFSFKFFYYDDLVFSNSRGGFFEALTNFLNVIDFSSRSVREACISAIEFYGAGFIFSALLSEDCKLVEIRVLFDRDGGEPALLRFNSFLELGVFGNLKKYLNVRRGKL